MKMKSTLLLCLCLFTSTYLHAQAIIGKLVDAKTKQAIALVNLSLASQNQPTAIKYTSSDTLGRFEFKEIPIGKYILSATSMGYQKIQRELTINENTVKKLDSWNHFNERRPQPAQRNNRYRWNSQFCYPKWSTENWGCQ
ncbi:carboxypeptidase-like regulatory domain-containing protein [Pedobacter sp. UC225_65]|uniref:carboxypeptidase-like regulatory domain-containing protein n=1 Tax=Pedobacter sp. UC225_65 TaxID=3350173 RepID=UPI00366ED718